MKYHIKLSVVAAILALSLASAINNQTALAVTIYNDQFAVVKDTRSITFDQGRSDLYFADVSANIQTETVTFKAVTDPSQVKVFEQNFQGNLVNPRAILEKYIDKQITLWIKFGSGSIKVVGKLLGYNKGYVLETNNGISVYEKV